MTNVSAKIADGPQEEEQWPILREDLTLHKGPADASGTPTWTIHDPARNQYFSVDWAAFEVMSRLSLGSAKAICEQISAQTTLHLNPDDLKPIFSFLNENELTQRHGSSSSQWLYQKRKARNLSAWKHLVHNYLFFRVPLFKPDKFLNSIIYHLPFLWQPFFHKLTAVAFLLGAWGAFRQWGAFQSTLVDTFSLEGLLGFAGALIVIKTFHEFGHGLTAKRFGCRVPTMGVAFLVLWPMAYTDVTESWKLDSNRKRLIISSAGIATEIAVACWSLLAWSVLPDGGLRSVTFFLATTSIVATLAINASPFMRFDGYFVLCDFLGIPNLHQRSSAYTRWWLREQLFRLGDAPPEQFSSERHSFILIFAIATWVYRAVIFFGIAILVYNLFFKLLGIVLFVIELWYFIFRPVWQEVTQWRRRWAEISPVLRKRPAFYISIAAGALLVIPYDITVNTQGVLKPERSLKVVTFQPSRVIQMPPSLGSRVEEGAQVMALESPELEHRIRRAQIRVEALKRQAGSAAFDRETAGQQTLLREQFEAALGELEGLIAERERLRPLAPFAGRVVDMDPDLYVGEWFPRNSHVVTVVDESTWVVDTYVTESDLSRIDVGNWARFIPEGAGIGAVWAEVTAIDRDASRVISEGALASTAGGALMVRVQNNKMVPDRSLYRVRLRVSSGATPPAGTLRGGVTIIGFPKSVLGDVIRGGVATFVREAGF